MSIPIPKDRADTRAAYTAPTPTIWLWGSGAVASALMIQTFGLILPIFNTGFGLDPILLSWTLMLPRLIDGMIDPVMGHFSDNVNSRWGRRKPFLVATTFIGAFLLAGIWWADPNWPAHWQLIYLGAFATAYYCNWGTYAMTHGALGYELSDDYHQRSRVAAVYTIFSQIVILAVGWTYWLALRPVFGGEINGIRWIGGVMAVLVIATGLIPVIACRERFAHTNRTHVPMLKALRQSLGIKPFRTYLAMRFFWAFGTVVFGQLIFYVNVYHVCAGDKALATKISGIGTAISVALTFALLPFTARISRLIGKRRGIILGIALVVIQAIAIPLLYQPSFPYLQLLSAALFAPAIVIANVLRDAVVPDICDLDELQYGQRREALFNAVISFVYKMEVSLCVVLSGYLIAWSGFNAKAVVQAPTVLSNLQWFAYAPNLCFAAMALVMAIRFPVTEESMADIRQELEARRARQHLMPPPDLIASTRSSFQPGLPWADDKGSPINAHGGGVIHFGGCYYWYGEHKIPGRSEQQLADGGVHCYSSSNLTNWTDEGVVLEVDSVDENSDIAAGCILERPKVLFNEQSKTFVMFFKLYPRGTGYDTGFVGVATAEKPTGPFIYRHKFNGGGLGKGTGDFAFVLDKSGVPFHLAVRKPDKVFCAARLRPDFLFPEGDYRPVEGIERHTEAPAIVMADEGYYLIGSASTGFDPNAARAFFAKDITGPYRQLANPAEGINPHNNHGPEKTFGGQSSFVIPVAGRANAFIAMFDVWKPESPIDGGYIWLPVELSHGSLKISWKSEWGLHHFEKK